MPERTSFLGRGAVFALLSIVLPTSGCGGSSSATSGSTDAGSFGGNSGSSGAGGGSGASSGTSSSGGGGGSGAGAPSTCIVGSQGCLCDSAGGCAPSLTCTPQTAPQPSLCCSGSNCTPSGGTIGASCGTATGAAACTPGITIPAAAGGNDSCGYPVSTFAESTTLCALKASGGGAQPAVLQVFYDDEHALTLGCARSTYPVSALPSDPAAVSYPQTGDPACVDAVARPLRPVLYITDITADPTCTAGDLQHGGHPYDPVAIFGTWKSATEASDHSGTPNQDPTANNWNLGSGADTVPSSCEQTMGPGGPGMPGGPAGPGGPGGMAGGNYGTELRFEVGLISGHSYRFQVIVHDGDQNKGGDSGEACAVFCAGGSSCPQGVTACQDNSQCPEEGTICTQGCCLPPPPETPSPTPDASVLTPR